MCEIRRVSDKKEFVGYKAVLIDGETGGFVSPATFMPYSVGEIGSWGADDVAWVADMDLCGFVSPWCMLVDPGEGAGFLYKPEMAGRTAVFVERGEALALAEYVRNSQQPRCRSRYGVGVVMMTVRMRGGGRLYEGEYDGGFRLSSAVLVGDEVAGIELVDVVKDVVVEI